MKLILTQDITGLGGPGDIVEVKDGFGRNYLVPRGFALVWSKGGEKQISTIRRSRDARSIRDRGQAQQVKTQLESETVSLAVRAGDAGRLFGAVTASDVIDAVSAAGGPTLDKRSVQLPQPLKSLGDHTVTINLHPDVTATLRLTITPQ